MSLTLLKIKTPRQIMTANTLCYETWNGIRSVTWYNVIGQFTHYIEIVLLSRLILSVYIDTLVSLIILDVGMG